MEVIEEIGKTYERIPLNILQQKKDIKKPDSIKKCLFGPPNQEDIKNLYEEQRRIDRERIKRRFGFDIDDLENTENVRTSKRRKTQNENYQRKKRLSKPRCIRKIIDFYPVKKHPETEQVKKVEPEPDSL